MDPVPSKEYSWRYVTVDSVLTTLPCELAYAYIVPSGATTDSAIYHGRDAKGEKVIDFKDAAVTGHPFDPPVPVYCPNGLFVDVGSNVSGIFVQWRNL